VRRKISPIGVSGILQKKSLWQNTTFGVQFLTKVK
jgi:hypothetical protein